MQRLAQKSGWFSVVNSPKPCQYQCSLHVCPCPGGFPGFDPLSLPWSYLKIFSFMYFLYHVRCFWDEIRILKQSVMKLPCTAVNDSDQTNQENRKLSIFFKKPHLFHFRILCNTESYKLKNQQGKDQSSGRALKQKCPWVHDCIVLLPRFTN